MHRCEKTCRNGVEDYFMPAWGYKWIWVRRSGTEARGVPIYHCPYCGEELGFTGFERERLEASRDYDLFPLPEDIPVEEEK